MKRNLIAMTIVAMAFGTAHAADGADGSEFFHQAGAGVSEVEAGLSYHLGSTVRAKGTTQDIKFSGLQDLGASYQYGINEMLALGGRLAYQSTETEFGTSKTKVNGLKDIVVFLEGTNNMGMGNLKFGADFSLGLAKPKFETDRQDATTGGMALAPYVGWDMTAGPGWLGAKLQYTWKGERTEDHSGTDEKFKGGDILGVSAFYEMLVADITLGGALEFNSIGEVKQTAPGAETQESKSQTSTGIDLYSKIPFGGWDLLPGINYTFSNSELDKTSVMLLNVAARFAF